MYSFNRKYKHTCNAYAVKVVLAIATDNASSDVNIDISDVDQKRQGGIVKRAKVQTVQSSDDVLNRISHRVESTLFSPGAFPHLQLQLHR